MSTENYYPAAPDDLPARREFRRLAAPGRGAQLQVPGFRLHGGQEFAAAFMSPDTPYPRLLVNWKVGTGKTLAGIAMAEKFAPLFRGTGRRVIIVGFTRQVFLAELLRHPELGYISPQERLELDRLAAAADSDPRSARQYASVLGTYRRRLTDTGRGGVYKFYGYREFANALVRATPAGSAAGFRPADLFARGARFAEQLEAAVGGGLAAVNEDLLAEARGALILADEFHNTYNVQRPNNYGVALAYLLSRLDRDGTPARAVFLTATVIGGNPEEIVDVLRALVPEADRGGPLERSDFFERRGGEIRLRPGAEERITRLARGRVSFLVDADEASYPRRVFEGAALEYEGSPIPYLKFVACPMSALHRRTLERMYAESDADAGEDGAGEDGAGGDGADAGEDGAGEDGAGEDGAGEDGADADAGEDGAGGDGAGEDGADGAGEDGAGEDGAGEDDAGEDGADGAGAGEDGAGEDGAGEDGAGAGGAGAGGRYPVAVGAMAIYDMVYPNPESTRRGLYRSNTPAVIAGAPEKWRREAGVAVERLDSRAGSAATLSGPFLGRDRIRRFSEKYYRLVSDVQAALRGGPGKVLIYHHRVRLSGVLQIRELLRANGLIPEGGLATPGTLCAVCGRAKRDHGKQGRGRGHDFRPARFAVVHSELDRSSIARAIARFNAPSNDGGEEVRVFVGSKLIREGLNFRAVTRMLVCSLPTDIPTLIQVLGRAVRKGSHAALPPERREVRVSIYVSTPGAARGPDPEVRRYGEKMRVYLEVQRVERAVRAGAADRWMYPRAAAGAPSLEALPDDSGGGPLPPPANETTYLAYGFAEADVEAAGALIMAHFPRRQAWTYEELWEAVRSERVRGVAADPRMLPEEAFARALQGLGTAAPGGGAAIVRAGEYYVPYAAFEGTPAAMCRRVVVPLADGSDDPEGARIGARLARASGGVAAPRDLLFALDAPAHGALLRMLIEGRRPAGADARRVAELGRELYADFRMILAAKSALSAEGRRLVGGDARGYQAATALWFWSAGGRSSSRPRWVQVPRRHLAAAARPENGAVVGYLEARGGEVRFKVRPPAAEIRASEVRDARSLARGAVCETRPKAEQQRYLAALGLGPLKGARACRAILRELLDREQAARAGKGRPRPQRWFYLPGEPLPDVRG